MPIVQFRIDDRLIHGQVVEGWLNHLEIDRIVVVSNDIARDPFYFKLFRLAVPEDIEVEVMEIEKAAFALKDHVLDKDNILILFPGPIEALSLLNGGLPIGSINIGGLHFAPGKKQLLRSLAVNFSECEALVSLVSAGVRLESRALPQDSDSSPAGLLQDTLKEFEEKKQS